MNLTPSAQKVQRALQEKGLSLQVVELPASTRTALDAAEAVGCQVGQIVKSLIFRTRQSDRPILVLASGANQVDEKKIGKLLSEPITKADANFVRERTGYAIGGVPPVGHLQGMPTFIDQDLLQYDEIWAAAGTPHAVFRLTPDDLVRITAGSIAHVAPGVET